MTKNKIFLGKKKKKEIFDVNDDDDDNNRKYLQRVAIIFLNDYQNNIDEQNCVAVG